MNTKEKVETIEEPINPLTDTGKFYLLAKRAVKDALAEERRSTGRNVGQAIWHGITVAKAEIWEAMGWPNK